MNTAPFANPPPQPETIMELFARVIQAVEGEDPPRTWQTTRGPVVVRRASFVDWTHRIERTRTLTALECVALVNSVVGNFNMAEERRIVDAWSKALLHAAKSGAVKPRDPVTLLPIEEVPEDWAAWGVSLADADKFVASMGMTWTMTEIVEHMVEEANEAVAREYELVSGGNEGVPKPKPEPVTPSSKPDWKQIARGYATEAWDARRKGSNPSKESLAETVRKRLEAEGIQGMRGPLTKENIVREALNIWNKPIGLKKSPGVP